jgi:hypothetical protein
MWSTWTDRNSLCSWIEARWLQSVTINGARIRFFADRPLGLGIGIAPRAQ